MNKKISMLIITVILTIIIFLVSTYMQKQLVDYVPTMKCMVVKNDIEVFEVIDKDDIVFVDMPIEITAQTRIAQSLSDIDGLYLKDKIYKGQILVMDQFDTRENLMVYKAEVGKEKISIKIKNAENGVSYTVRENSLVNVYATIRNEYSNIFLDNKDIKKIGAEGDGYTIIKILDSIKVLGVFDSNGELVDNFKENNIDTILVAVTPEEAQKINLIRDVATFNITELGNEKVEI